MQTNRGDYVAGRAEVFKDGEIPMSPSERLRWEADLYQETLRVYEDGGEVLRRWAWDERERHLTELSIRVGLEEHWGPRTERYQEIKQMVKRLMDFQHNRWPKNKLGTYISNVRGLHHQVEYIGVLTALSEYLPPPCDMEVGNDSQQQRRQLVAQHFMNYEAQRLMCQEIREYAANEGWHLRRLTTQERNDRISKWAMQQAQVKVAVDQVEMATVKRLASTIVGLVQSAPEHGLGQQLSEDWKTLQMRLNDREQDPRLFASYTTYRHLGPRQAALLGAQVRALAWDDHEIRRLSKDKVDDLVRGLRADWDRIVPEAEKESFLHLTTRRYIEKIAVLNEDAPDLTNGRYLMPGWRETTSSMNFAMRSAALGHEEMYSNLTEPAVGLWPPGPGSDEEEEEEQPLQEAVNPQQQTRAKSPAEVKPTLDERGMITTTENDYVDVETGDVETRPAIIETLFGPKKPFKPAPTPKRQRSPQTQIVQQREAPTAKRAPTPRHADGALEAAAQIAAREDEAVPESSAPRDRLTSRAANITGSDATVEAMAKRKVPESGNAQQQTTHAAREGVDSAQNKTETEKTAEPSAPAQTPADQHAQRAEASQDGEEEIDWDDDIEQVVDEHTLADQMERPSFSERLETEQVERAGKRAQNKKTTVKSMEMMSEKKVGKSVQPKVLYGAARDAQMKAEREKHGKEAPRPRPWPPTPSQKDFWATVNAIKPRIAGNTLHWHHPVVVEPRGRVRGTLKPTFVWGKDDSNNYGILDAKRRSTLSGGQAEFAIENPIAFNKKGGLKSKKDQEFLPTRDGGGSFKRRTDEAYVYSAIGKQTALRDAIRADFWPQEDGLKKINDLNHARLVFEDYACTQKIDYAIRTEQVRQHTSEFVRKAAKTEKDLRGEVEKLEAKNDTLESEVGALKAENAELKRRVAALEAKPGKKAAEAPKRGPNPPAAPATDATPATQTSSNPSSTPTPTSTAATASTEKDPTQRHADGASRPKEAPTPAKPASEASTPQPRSGTGASSQSSHATRSSQQSGSADGASKGAENRPAIALGPSILTSKKPAPPEQTPQQAQVAAAQARKKTMEEKVIEQRERLKRASAEEAERWLSAKKAQEEAQQQRKAGEAERVQAEARQQREASAAKRAQTEARQQREADEKAARQAQQDDFQREKQQILDRAAQDGNRALSAWEKDRIRVLDGGNPTLGNVTQGRQPRAEKPHGFVPLEERDPDGDYAPRDGRAL